jgi:transcriptional regulator with XRE-family HTH domain
MEHGSTQLADWIDRKGYGQAEAARKLGLHKSTLNKILKGTRLPGRQSAATIRDMAGVPLDAWVPTAVGKRAKRLAAKARNMQHFQGANA